ncbi:hypothetical protein DGWBC_0954 [Dehalogenimonas sp. WBC-2]|nr:hypothetical protein DGWBC_0954 [Dehalogenimonas sp. WBC-2]
MKKPDWQVTATTIKCDAVEDEITIMVHPDGSAKCASYVKYGATKNKTISDMAKRAKKMGLTLKCEGPLCHRVIDYRDKIMAEEETAV